MDVAEYFRTGAKKAGQAIATAAPWLLRPALAIPAWLLGGQALQDDAVPRANVGNTPTPPLSNARDGNAYLAELAPVGVALAAGAVVAFLLVKGKK